MDANQIHEILVLILIAVFLPTFGVTMVYLLSVIEFLKDLREREHDLWVKIGSPTPANMVLLPFINFHKYYAFLPHVLERAKPGSEYKSAKTVLRLMRVCSVLMCLMFLNVFIVIIWMIANDL